MNNLRKVPDSRSFREGWDGASVYDANNRFVAQIHVTPAGTWGIDMAANPAIAFWHDRFESEEELVDFLWANR